MKQVKISSFFSIDSTRRKRTFDDSEASTSRPANKKRKVGKGKTNKENGSRTLLSVFTVAQPTKPVLSPKKLSENVPASPQKTTGSCPERNAEARDLEKEFSDVGFEEMFDSELWHQKKSELTFGRPVRCEVIRFRFNSQPRCEQVVELKAIGSEKRGLCKLRDVWTFMNLKAGDVVCVKAEESDGDWIVNSRNGYVILKPDIVLPVTTLVRGMYCLRRGVLSTLHKNLKGNGQLMIMGRVVHDLLQEALRKKLETEEEVTGALRELLTSHEYLRDFYLNGMKVNDVAVEAAGFVPKIVNFIGTYVRGEIDTCGNNFRGRLTEVMDIEELVTSEWYGVQGRVDVTVKVDVNNRKRVMPLELKTGRASFSKDHKIQVMMYTLILDELVRNVDSGLLLYLKDGILEEVTPDMGDVRDFLLLRNEFVKYGMDETILPDPIWSASCGQCTHARICTSYLRSGGLDALSSNHPMRELTFPDIADSHVEYFVNWTRMLFRERKSERGRHVEVVTMEGVPSRVGDDFRYAFRATKAVNIQPGATVDVAGERGSVLDVEDGVITVLLRRQLALRDRYTLEALKSGIQYLYLTNLAFFLDTEYQRLRELIVDRAPPKFDPGITKNLLNEDCLKIMQPLNMEQRRAIFKVMASKEYLLIRGPPGTGKTETIVSLIKFLHARNKTVLITGHTHSSIDNILLKLTGVEYLRFGSLSSVDERLHDHCFSRLIEKCRTAEAVEGLYKRKVMASTCLGLDLDMIDRVRFDVCLIDESSQVMQAEAIRPLLMSRKFVLIGDSNQLRPIVRDQEAKKLGMDVSIFERLEREEATVSLTQQYRMNRALNNLANELTYAGLLRCGNDRTAEATLQIARPASSVAWMRDVLSPEMERSVVFVDTSECRERDVRDNRINPLEAGIIACLLSEMRVGGVREEDVGVISPFCGQVRLVTSILRKAELEKVEVSTVDQYQGRDKDVILFSCVKRNISDSVDGHILSDHRRMTVAITRARVKLIVIGDAKTVSVYEPMRKLMSSLSQQQFIRLRNGENDFSIDDLGLESNSYILS